MLLSEYNTKLHTNIGILVTTSVRTAYTSYFNSKINTKVHVAGILLRSKLQMIS